MLDINSSTANRIKNIGGLVENYSVILPSSSKDIVRLAENIIVYGSGGNNKVFNFFLIFFLAKRLLSTGQYDILSIQDQYFLGFLGLFLSKLYKVPLEIQVHGFEKFRGFRAIFARFVIKRANVVRAVSLRLKNSLIKEFGIKESKVYVLPLFVLIGKHTRNLEVKNTFNFLTVARLVPVKNIDLQIKAMVSLSNKYPEVRLKIVGDGPEKGRLIRLVLKLKLGDIVEFVGYQKEVDSWYENADVFVLSSDSEGWGVVVIEAASYGLPIIMTDVGCAGEFIHNKENGIIIPVKDVTALNEAMIDLVEKPELRMTLGKKAKESSESIMNLEFYLKKQIDGWCLGVENFLNK